MDALKSMSLTKDTIILFASDHGCHFKTRNSEYKRSCHESSVRIPCAAISPGFNNKGKRTEPLSIVDLTPTMLDAAGIDIPEEIQGRSILPALEGRESFPVKEHFIQISEDKVSRAIRTKRWKYAVTAFHLDGNENPCSDKYQEEFLYDLGADPFEQQNLLGQPAMEKVQEHLRGIMKKRIKEIENADVEIEPAPEVLSSGQRKVFDFEVFQ